MYINVAQLLKETIGASRNYMINEHIGEHYENQIEGVLTLLRTDRSILVRGNMTASLIGSCNRCLSPTSYSIGFVIEDEFFPSVDIESGLPLATKSTSSSINKNHILDLSETFRQYIQTGIPMKLLCQPDCAGICPSCGRNLNESYCKCSVKSYDKRKPILILQRRKGEI